MKQKFKVWQLCNDPHCREDHSPKIVEVDDHECPACECIGRPPPHAEDGQACVIAYVAVDKPMQTQLRELEVMTLRAGLTVSQKFGFAAWLAAPQKGWACERPDEEALARHGLA